jgi:hypothetical protein
MRNKKQRHRSLLKICGLILVIVLLYIAYQQISAILSKKDFNNARSIIDSVYSENVSKFGNPDNFKSINNCEQTNSGTNCNVSTSFIYGVGNREQAEAIYKNIQDTIKSHQDLKPTKTLSSSISTTAVGYVGAQDLYNLGKLVCSAKYLYDNSQASFLKLKDTSKKPFYIVIGCTGPAKKKFY